MFTSDGEGGVLDGVMRLGRLFGIGADSLVDGFALYEILRHGVILAVMAIGATPLFKKIADRVAKRAPLCREAAANILLPVAILLCTAALVGSSYNPFLYFRF